MEKNKIQGIDLFSGAGGMSIGASWAGVEVKYAVELDRFASSTYVQNHHGVEMFNRDIRKISKEDFRNLSRSTPKMIFGGPPCQGFSTSNQTTRGLDNADNWLFLEYLRLVKLIQADWVVFENVKGLSETAGGYFLEIFSKKLQKLGYRTSTFILNAMNFGVPQSRNRLFIIGSLHGQEIREPVPATRKPLTVKVAFDDLPDIENGNESDVSPYREKARTR